MTLKRRAFLQQAGSALAALGISEAALSLLTDRYQQALAQPTCRKLALLVGINQYAESVCDYVSPRGSALNGCLTDVELQRELLIHRFGFQPADILVLTDQAATRQGIEEAFIHHLVQQATSGDVVLFHFSGLGSQIRVDGTSEMQASLVPVDGMLPTAETPIVHDLLLDTLGLLLSSLATNQVITVLDAGFSRLGRTLQGNLHIRSRPDTPVGLIDAAEQAVQDQLSQQTRISIAQIRQRWQTGQVPGIVLQASSLDRPATEAQWNGFSAGLFTYALTQRLWQSLPDSTIAVTFQQAVGTIWQTMGLEQQPVLNGQAIAQQILPDATGSSGAEGVIRSVEEDGKAQIWLAGLPAPVLENAAASWFSLANLEQPDQAVPQLQLRSREGLIGKARSLTGIMLQPNQQVQEAVRVLPRNIGLTVAIDNSLERIERVDATSAFAAIPRVSSVIAGEQSADLLFGKTQPTSLIAASLPLQATASSQAMQGIPPEPAELPPAMPTNGYGLFYPSHSAIPNTRIQNIEAVKAAVTRMAPQFKTLLAIKLLRLTQNQGSSRLGVRAFLETLAPQARLLAKQETLRLPLPASSAPGAGSANAPLILTKGSQIRYRLKNYGSFPVYFLLTGVDTRLNPVIFYPTQSGLSNADQSRGTGRSIHPDEEIILPLNQLKSWQIQSPTGLAETHIIFSRLPFYQTEQVLTAESRSAAEPFSPIANPLEVAQAILQDLHDASSAVLPPIDLPTDSYALDVNAWATLSFVYQVTC